ncbi:hypothetical protein CRG98_014382 [Punica granatum]|uniref:Secreted protein n=1 Tax=Punica granatum TaxID=22663 RepID=A0A2I0KAT1_PUNGR|nr:hypothetical protein CRG98_014382 [Punica granatum]
MLTNCRSFFFLLLILLLHDFAFRGPIQLLFWTIFATASSPKLAETRAAALPNMVGLIEWAPKPKDQGAGDCEYVPEAAPHPFNQLLPTPRARVAQFSALRLVIVHMNAG